MCRGIVAITSMCAIPKLACTPDHYPKPDAQHCRRSRPSELVIADNVCIDKCACVYAATLVDVIGSAAIFTVAEHSGVSLQISVDYLSELPAGEDCEITATVAKLGRSTATAIVELRHKRTGRLTARGTHVKFLGSGLPEVRAKL